MFHPSCPTCGAPLDYAITIFGKRKQKIFCKNWICNRNFLPPTESVIKSMRGFLDWWSKLATPKEKGAAK